jgi:hypothetical protein
LILPLTVAVLAAASAEFGGFPAFTACRPQMQIVAVKAPIRIKLLVFISTEIPLLVVRRFLASLSVIFFCWAS